MLIDSYFSAFDISCVQEYYNQIIDAVQSPRAEYTTGPSNSLAAMPKILFKVALIACFFGFSVLSCFTAIFQKTPDSCRSAMSKNMTNVTRILDALGHGDVRAADELLVAVYQELRRLAAVRLSQEPPGHTLQATALVH